MFLWQKDTNVSRVESDAFAFNFILMKSLLMGLKQSSGDMYTVKSKMNTPRVIVLQIREYINSFFTGELNIKTYNLVTVYTPEYNIYVRQKKTQLLINGRNKYKHTLIF